MSLIAKKIINLLEQEAGVKLPNVGCIAGQSVAEAYFRIKNIDIKTRIKDVDYYINIKENKVPLFKIPEENKNRSYIQLKNNFVGEVNKKYASFEEDFLDGKEKFDEVKTYYNKYSIANTYDIGKLNVIEVFSPSWEEKNKDINFLKNTLFNFDLNCVEIGICLKTKRLIMTDRFKSFIKTKQVEITSYIRPVKTLIRFLEKQQYYKNAYFNFDYEANLIAAQFLAKGVSKSKIISYLRKRTGIKVILENYEKLTPKNKKKIETFFNLEQISFERIEVRHIPKSDSFYWGNLVDEDYCENIKRKMKYFIEDMKNKKKKLFILEQNLNYFNPKDVKLRQFVKKEDFQFKKEALQLLKYKEDQQDDRSFNKVDKFMKNTKRSQLNNAIVIIAADRIDCYSFLPKLRKISPVIKDNIKSLLKVKTLNDINKFMQNRSFVEILYSKKKMNIFISYIEKYNSYYFLKNLELLFFYEMDVFKILQINQHYLKEGVRHHSAFRKIIEYVKFKKKTEDIEFYLKRLFSLSKSNDLDFIGYIETGELPVAFLEKTEEEVDEYKKKLLKDASMSIETVDDDFFIFKRYRIRHIHSIFQLKAVGQEMHHCVGGYTKHLIQRTMVFFDIYDEKNVRYTLAAKWERVEDEKVLSVFDFKRKYNEIPGEDRFADIYDFLVEMKDKISIVLPQKRTNENPFNT